MKLLAGDTPGAPQQAPGRRCPRISRVLPWVSLTPKALVALSEGSEPGHSPGWCLTFAPALTQAPTCPFTQERCWQGTLVRQPPLAWPWPKGRTSPCKGSGDRAQAQFCHRNCQWGHLEQAGAERSGRSPGAELNALMGTDLGQTGADGDHCPSSHRLLPAPWMMDYAKSLSQRLVAPVSK